MTRKHLVTPALPYANGPAHLGHLVEHVQVNIFVRALRMLGEDVLYVCGADAHGTPIELSAMKHDVAPEVWVERIRQSHEASFAKFGVVYDGGYGTTHTEENRAHAGRIYEALKAGGKLKRKTIEQFYDPEAKRFLPDRFIKGTCPHCGSEDQYGDSCDVCSKTYSPTEVKNPKSAISGATPELRESEHIFVDLAAFRDVLVDWTSREGAVSGPVRNFLQDWLSDLRDWDISRDGPYFGFEIPGEENKYFYVWLDAPIGYISLTERAAKARGRTWEDYWKDPSTTIHHFIGKDILYFHTLFWPAMLSAAGYTLPSRVAAHGFLTVDGTKMSKSKGTFINADDFYEKLGEQGAEALRYYFACKLDGGINDLDLNLDDFTERVNADLVKNSVNLVSRSAQLLARTFEGKPSTFDDDAKELVSEVKMLALELEGGVEKLYRDLRYSQVVRRVTEISSLGNKYLQDNQPWEVAKTDPAKAQAMLTTAVWVGKVCMGLLSPIIPGTTAKAAKLFNLESFTLENTLAELVPDVPLGAFERLFDRLDKAVVHSLVVPTVDVAKPAGKTDKGTKQDRGKATVVEASGGATKDKKKGPSIPEPDAELEIDTFFRVELRAAKVLEAGDVEGADKLIRVKLDVGSLGERQVFAGLKPHVSPASLVGKTVVVVANLKPRKMKFGMSEGMILAAGDDVPTPVFAEGAKPGDRVR